MDPSTDDGHVHTNASSCNGERAQVSLLERSECFTGWVRQVNALLARGPELTIREARGFAAERLTATNRLRPLSATRMFELWSRFERFAFAFGEVRLVGDVTADLAAAFVSARTSRGRPTGATQSLRRTALRLLFRTLREYGLADHEPTLDLVVSPRARHDVRPLTHAEVLDARWAATSGAATSRATAIWALAESGMWPAEVALTTAGDIDFVAKVAHASGGAKAVPREVPLSDWAVDRLRARAAVVGSGRLVFDGEDGPGARLSITAVLRRTLDRAGLNRDPLISLDSIPAFAGRLAYEEAGSIEAAARRLGLTSLDRTARLIAHDWLDDES